MKNKKLKESIVKAVNDKFPNKYNKGQAIGDAVQQDIENIFYLSELADLLDFDIVQLSDNSNYWFQVNHYSKILGKSIIIKYDFREEFEDLDDFADYLISIKKGVEEIDAKLELITK